MALGHELWWMAWIFVRRVHRSLYSDFDRPCGPRFNRIERFQITSLRLSGWKDFRRRKSLGLGVPASLLARADQEIE
jgi:hypothetical protein